MSDRGDFDGYAVGPIVRLFHSRDILAVLDNLKHFGPAQQRAAVAPGGWGR